jgi:hypothetical protein
MKFLVLVLAAVAAASPLLEIAISQKDDCAAIGDRSLYCFFKIQCLHNLLLTVKTTDDTCVGSCRAEPCCYGFCLPPPGIEICLPKGVPKEILATVAAVSPLYKLAI